MTTKADMLILDDEKPPQFMRGVLGEQLRWLIRLRWLAVVGIVVAGLVCTQVFPVLASARPIYICAGALFVCNLFFLWVVAKRNDSTHPEDTVLGMVQVEVDSLVLTILLHFSGGITNPFVLFYVFHIIIATIILPRTLSFTLGISVISMFGLIAIGEMNGWPWLKHHPLGFSSTGSLWQNPVYVLGAFVAFAAMVVLTQYLTRTIVARITAKELEAARNKDVLEAVITAMGEGLVFVTNDGEVTICNPAAKEWTASSSNDNGNNQRKPGSLEDFLPGLAEHIKSLLAIDDKVVIACKPIKFNLDNQQKSYIEGKTCPVVDVDGHRLGYVVVGQDVTEHKKLEHDLMERTLETSEINEMLKMSRVKMAQREKMVAIGQMASGIAHEIGNPLASLSSVVQYLQRKIGTPEQDRYLGMIEKQVDRISMILKRMLSLSRPATSEYKWTDINKTIDGTLSLIRFDERAKAVAIKSIPNHELPMVWLNPQHLEQVLLNIVTNALDAMVAKKSEQQHILEVTREFRDEMVEIRISDTGIGMSSDVCRRAFESFFTTKEIGKGTGLGLYISYNLLSEIDGTIRLDSEPDRGTKVTIRVPVRPKKYLISGDGLKADSTDSAA